MNSGAVRKAELTEAKGRRALEDERRKRVARRVYEGGEMTVTEIARTAHANIDTVKCWAAEGGWKRG